MLRQAWQTVRRAWLPLVATMMGFHLLMLAVVSPLIAWLFREALRANGMVGLDFSAMRFTGGIGISITLIIVIMLLAFWLASLQFIVLVLMLRRVQRDESLRATEIWVDVRRTMRKLLRPSSFSLFCYLFFIVPLSGFGFASVLSQGIAVPSFISGELLKSPVTSAIWTGFMLLIALLNLRFALSLPVFALTTATGGRSMRLSWRLTRGWAAVRLVLAAIVVLLLAGIATLVLTMLTIAPTSLSDVAAPAASPAVAAFSLGIAQVVGLVLTALVLMMLGGVLLSLVSEREDQLSAELHEPSGAADPRPKTAQPSASSTPRRKRTGAFIAAATALAVAFGFFHLGTMQQLAQHPDTLVLGHRGFSAGGVENTIPGLEAAVAAGADLVEIDVMQTADKKFVVMHDATLDRLADQSVKVKDLTLDELTQITVHDQFGHEAKIPSLEEYIRRAQQLEMPLLIEVKSGGLDTADRVPLLVAELDSLDAMNSNIFHTLENTVVSELKRLRPDSTVGYILAFAGVDIPDTDADFVVVEQWSATQEMQDAAYREGYGFFSWTVNESTGMRELLRRDADGMITDNPDVALAARKEMQQETGLAGTLTDALTRFVAVF
jgi:glycerophosphoryl diester phosphodiesterase